MEYTSSSPPPPLSTSSSSTLSIRSFSSLYSTKPLLSVRLFSSSNKQHRRRHSSHHPHHRQSHWGFYKLFSSSDPTLYTSTPSSPPSLSRSQSCHDRIPSMKELTRRCTTTNTTGKPTTVMSIRAMELEALIDSYPHYTLHLTLTPRLCLDK